MLVLSLSLLRRHPHHRRSLILPSVLDQVLGHGAAVALRLLLLQQATAARVVVWLEVAVVGRRLGEVLKLQLRDCRSLLSNLSGPEQRHRQTDRQTEPVV